MIRRVIISIAFFVFSLAALASDSCGVRISLLTCTPGSELYSIFGHSALRVVDSTVGTDIVYNYGTFQFDDPDFYSKFVRGKLLYFLSREAYPDFVYAYRMENRGIDEQVLNLDCKQVSQVQEFLSNNIREENKFYKYDFLYDNCTTRLRDIIENFSDSSMRTDSIPEAKGMTFRNGIHFYLNQGHMYWSKLGIDLLLGSRIDKKMTNREAMFLPEFLESGLDQSVIGKAPLVKSKINVLTRVSEEDSNGLLSRPFFVFSFFALLMIMLGLSKNPALQKMVRLADTTLFLIIGLLGCLFVFMWFGTDHKQTSANYNLFWAWPIHIIAAFILYSRKTWIKAYLKIYMAALGITLLAWFFLPQEMNPALIPIILLMIYRSWKITQNHGAEKISG